MTPSLEWVKVSWETFMIFLGLEVFWHIELHSSTPLQVTCHKWRISCNMQLLCDLKFVDLFPM
jgi:hypothetical protein